MRQSLPIDLDQVALEAYCRRHFVTKLALFGSVLTERFGPTSDVDVLVEFDIAHVPTLFDVVEMEEELSGILGRAVHLCTKEDISEFFRDTVLNSAQTQYAA